MTAEAKGRGWHRIMTGWYVYTNAAGKRLAYVQRNRSFWDVTVLPMGDPAREITLTASPHTYREAKALAESQYKSLTALHIRRGRTELKRLADIGIL